jgi:hypothetical protein
MVKFASVSSLITQTSTLVKTLLAAVALIAALSGFYMTGKAMIAMPNLLAAHDSVVRAEFSAFDRMLCIQIADHRRMDWRLCYINPSEVVPVDYKVK